MEFTSREDIEAPIEQVFAVLSDFEGYERQGLRRGAEIRRTDSSREPGVGMAWDVKFRFRDKDREMKIGVSSFDRPNDIAVTLDSSGIDGGLKIELVALSRNRTRMNAVADMQPQTLAARLLIQSLKLARGNLKKRFHNRIADFAQDIEERCKRNA